MRVRLEKSGAIVLLDGQPIARGGEAAIYAVPERPDLLGKIYHEPTAEQADKLAAMIANPPADPTAKQGHTSIAWPTERLFGDDGGQCVGFVMPRVDKVQSLLEVYNPKSRLQTWPLFHYGYLLRTARNLAIAVRALHSRGYVLADLNESNVLVNGQTLVTIVDTDSFQTRTADRVFRCMVGKPEFIAPEIQNTNFAEIDRFPEHDHFALGVLIFQLLMQGTHPFAGRFSGQGEPEIPAKRIAAGHWPYARKRRGPYEPNPMAPSFGVLPTPLRELMHLCFEDGHDRPAMRPDAGALAEADAELVECLVNGQHRFHKDASSCPWCDLMLKQGRDPFPSKEAVQSRTNGAAVAKTPAAVPAAALVSKPAAGQTPPPPSAPRPSAPVKPPRGRPVGRNPAAAALLSQALTPWPWVIACGVTALVVLIWLIAANARRPITRPADETLARDAADKDSIDRIDRGSDRFGQVDGEGRPIRGGDSPPEPHFTPMERIGEIRTFVGHTFSVNSIALSNKGDLALSGGLDAALRLWDTATGKELRNIHAKVIVLSAALSPDGRFAISGGRGENVLRMWDLNTGMEVRSFKGHTDNVNAVAFSPDGRRVLSGGDDGTIRLWNVETGEEIKTLHGHTGPVTSVAFSPDGGHAVSGCVDRKVRVWDLDGDREPRAFAGHTGPVASVAFNGIGGRIVSSSQDGTIRLWNVETGETLQTLTGHDGAVRCAAFTPDGRGVFSGGDDGTVRLWDADAGVMVWRSPAEDASPVAWVAFGGMDGSHAVSCGADKLGHMWRLPDPQASPEQIAAHPPVVAARPLPKDPPPPEAAPAKPDRQLQCFNAHKDVVNSVAYSPNGKQVLTGCKDGLVYLWDVQTGEKTACDGAHLGEVRCVAFSPDGALAATGGGDNVARFWNAKNGALAGTPLEGHTYEILALAFVNQGRGLLTGAVSGEANADDANAPTDGMIRYWYTPLGNPTDGQEYKRYNGPPTGVACMALTGNLRRVLVSGSPVVVGDITSAFYVWDALQGKATRAFQADDLGTIHSIAVAGLGAHAVTTGDDGDVRLWDVNTGKEMRKFPGHTGAVWCAAFSTSGAQLLTGGDDKTVRLWDVATGKQLGCFTGHTGPVRSVAFSTDAQRAVSGGDDRTARIWNLAP